MSRPKSALINSPLYPLARNIYHGLFGRVDKADQTAMSTFYGQFFVPGERVFDVGALYGEYASIYAGCGAEVIAIEPNPAHRDRLLALSRIHNIRPVFAAISDAPGSAVLNVCSTPGYSTLTSNDADWMKDCPDYDGVVWTDKVEVPVRTLDSVRDEFGEPAFVKIDVEGFELNVLKGMSFRPRYLSFEFGARRKEAAFECLELIGARNYEFRPIVGREYRFVTPEWMNLDVARAWLEEFDTDQAEYGDMFAHKL